MKNQTVPLTDNEYTSSETDDFGGITRASFNWPGINLRYSPLERDGLQSVNKHFLLKRGTGWTRAAIERFLGEPDRLLPLRRTIDRPAVVEARYEFSRVLAVEDSHEFQEWVWRRARHAPRPARRAEGTPVYGFGGGIPEIAEPAFKALGKRDRRIVRLLMIKGLRQRTVAAQTGVSQQTVSRIKLEFLAQMQQDARNITGKKCFSR